MSRYAAGLAAINAVLLCVNILVACQHAAPTTSVPYLKFPPGNTIAPTFTFTELPGPTEAIVRHD